MATRKPISPKVVPTPAAPSPVSAWLLPLRNPVVQGLILVLLAVVLYANTFGHEYAVDDYVVIVENEYTKKGFAGIVDHFTEDSFTGYFGKRADELLTGGRYRPLSLVSFAVEWQIFGRNPGLSHVVNVLCYGLLVFLIWNFLRKQIFTRPDQPEFAFWATFLFAIHPIHTEVVANIKGRDELLSLIFLILSTHWCMDYYKNNGRNILLLLGALASYFGALLAKENGFTWIAILPLTLFVFTKLPKSKIATATGFYVGVLALYFIVRTKLTGSMFSGQESTDILNSPYINATFIQKYATIVWVLGKYFVLLLFPHPLAWDYSFNNIPYKDLSDPMVWLSLVALTGILGYGLYRLPKRDPVAYGILFYYLSLFLASNILVNIGAFMADRFLFQPSLGLVIVIGTLLYRLSQSSVGSGIQKGIGFGLMAYALIFGGMKTFSRNLDWKNNESLYPHDAQVVPNSAKAVLAAGEAHMHIASDTTGKVSEAEKKKHYTEAFHYYEKALKIYPQYNDAYLRQAVTLIIMEKYQEAEVPLARAAKLYPENEKLRKYQQVVAGQYFKESVAFRQKSFQFLEQKQQDSADIYYQKAIDICKRAIQVKPDYTEGYMELGNYYGFAKKFEDSYKYFEQALRLDPANANIWYNAGVAYFTGGKNTEGRQAMEKCLQLDPNGSLAPQAKQYLQPITNTAIPGSK